MGRKEELGLIYLETYEFNSTYKSEIYVRGEDLFIIDLGFDKEVDQDRFFDYSKYCSSQNAYMQTYKRVFRFNDDGDEDKLIAKISAVLEEEDFVPNDDGGSFNKSHLDNSPLEAIFEDVFVSTYGAEYLDCLYKEESISSHGGRNYFIDYVIKTRLGNFAFEENGVNYHHPLIVGKSTYESLLDKQNAIVKLGYKLFRFSTDNLGFKDKIEEELLTYLPDKSTFIPKPIFLDNRDYKLYKHQEEALSELDQDRKANKNTSLIVMSTAAGKSQIVLSDLEKDYILEAVRRILIMVPTTRIRQDWEKRIQSLKGRYEVIDVLTYVSSYKKHLEVEQDYYDYIVFDEAHHAVASNCKSVVQYFKPKYLIGLTATDERLDQRRLEEVFGQYNVKLSLVEAIDKGVVSNIRAYRLESNINLSEVRYDGKDFVCSDLETRVVVSSRNELIAKLLKKYFSPRKGFYKQGIVFCVNKEHCKRVVEELRKLGLTAEAVYGGNSKNEAIFQGYQEKKIQFLCSCQLISEGWDSPQTEIVVMARPTLSKVLYLQQIGRGLRKYPGKECLYLIDVVDIYGAKLRPWTFNSLFHIASYSPFMGVRNNDIDYFSILGLSESELALKEIDIFTFEEKYKDYLSLEQAARELFVGTATLSNWNKKGHYASLYLPMGRSQMPYFSKEDIARIQIEKKLSIHNEETIYEDFFAFIQENQLTFSFKLVFLLECLRHFDQEGNVNLTSLGEAYAEFYKTRIRRGLPVDKPNCIYTLERLNDIHFVTKSILDNPFEKFERKRFFFVAKDLNIISLNPVLWGKLTKDDKDSIYKLEKEYLEEYYSRYGGAIDGYYD